LPRQKTISARTKFELEVKEIGRAVRPETGDRKIFTAFGSGEFRRRDSMQAWKIVQLRLRTQFQSAAASKAIFFAAQILVVLRNTCLPGLRQHFLADAAIIL
jgi:hypothetical protein